MKDETKYGSKSGYIFKFNQSKCELEVLRNRSEKLAQKLLQLEGHQKVKH